jgi:tetratricopeptide (TPR) repeat protein
MEARQAVTHEPRLEKLKEMAARFPNEPRARYFLAHELFRIEDWAGAAEQYDAYVKMAPGDEGAALKNLGLCHERLGRTSAAAEAYRLGIERAVAQHHDGLASEIRFLLGELDA